MKHHLKIFFRPVSNARWQKQEVSPFMLTWQFFNQPSKSTGGKDDRTINSNCLCLLGKKPEWKKEKIRSISHRQEQNKLSKLGRTGIIRKQLYIAVHVRGERSTRKTRGGRNREGRRKCEVMIIFKYGEKIYATDLKMGQRVTGQICVPCCLRLILGQK